MIQKKYFLGFVKYVLYSLFFIMVVSCARNGNTSQSDWLLTESQRDSAMFSKYHHYNIGTNFISKSDSLRLYSHLPGIVMLASVSDTAIYLRNGMDFVVTEIFKPLDFKERWGDSVWLRVASDNMHLGWVEENVMLEKSTPISPISQLITTFSGKHIYWFYFIVTVTGLIVAFRKHRRKKMWFIHFKDINSIYPMFFMICVATAASVYAVIQMFLPDMWVEFYFNPSLNPIGQPFVMALFLCLVWLCILFLVSVFFDLYEKVSFEDAVSYFVSLIAWAGVVYIVLTFTIPFYIGFLIYLIYMFYIIYKYNFIKKYIDTK